MPYTPFVKVTLMWVGGLVGAGVLDEGLQEGQAQGWCHASTSSTRMYFAFPLAFCLNPSE